MYENLINNILMSSLISSIIILFIFLLKKILLKKYTKTLIYYLWIFPILKMIIIFRFSIFIPNKIHRILFKESYIVNSNLIIVYNSYKNLYLYKILFCVWIIGVGIFLIYNIYNYLNFSRKTRFLASSIDDDSINNLYSKILCELNIKKKISLKYCKGIGSPLGIGVFKPAILIPEHTNYKLKELELILKHELIHFKRYDLYYKILIMVVMSIHWFNPVAYIMCKSINYDCELSCDEILLKGSNNELRKLYALTFIKSLKDNKNNNQRLEIMTGFTNDKETLKKRVENIIDLNFRKKGLVIGVLVGIISFTSFFNIKTFAESDKLNLKPLINSTKIDTKEADNVKNIRNLGDEHSDNSLDENVDDENSNSHKPRVKYEGPIKNIPEEFKKYKEVQERIKRNPDEYITLKSN